MKDAKLILEDGRDVERHSNDEKCITQWERECYKLALGKTVPTK